jgi:hypothetical protein
MTKSFSKLYSDFWINYDNSEVVGLGVETQLMALYLQGNSHRSMLGVYYLPLLYIASDLKLPFKKVRIALEKLCKINYCTYDEKTQYVWVHDLAFEQIGEKVDERDNRTKALHDIWESLPSKLEFLEEIYQKYSTAFHFVPRVFEKPSKACALKETNEIKTELAVADVSSGTNINKNTNIPTSTNTATATNSDVHISKDIQSLNSNIDTNIQSSMDSLPLVPIFETPLEFPVSLPEAVTTDAVFENSLLVTPSVGFTSPFKGASKPLASPFEGALDPLRSNIEDRNKKEEIESEKEKRKDINNYTVPTLNIVAQARPCAYELPDKIFFEEAKKVKAIEKATFVPKLNDLPTTQDCLDTNSERFLVLAPKMELVPVEKSKTFIAKNIADVAVIAIFEHWKNVMQHPKSNLDRKRIALIHKALQLGYSIQQLCDAITGCSYTPHNIGQNDRGQRYDGLQIILRDADQIDRFMYNCHHPPKSFTEADRRLEANIDVAKNWVKTKLKEAGFRRNNYV